MTEFQHAASVKGVELVFARFVKTWGLWHPNRVRSLWVAWQCAGIILKFERDCVTRKEERSVRNVTNKFTVSRP